MKSSWKQVVTVRTPDGFVHQSTWQVADVKRTLVSASDFIPPGDDLIIGTSVACIMNTKKKEKSMLRKATCTCSMCL